MIDEGQMPNRPGAGPASPHSACPAAVLAELQTELAARDKTIAVLIARLEGHFAKSSSAIAVIEQNLSLEQQVRRRTRELEESRDSLTRALAELKLAQSQLLETSKLEAIGQLAAGVAHELNTPIQYVSDNTSFLDVAFAKLLTALDDTVAFVAELEAQGLAPAPLASLKEKLRPLNLDWLRAEVPRALAETTEGLGRVSHIVGAMKEFSHPSSDRKEAVDLADAISTTITVARHEWKYVAEIETRFDPELPAVPCYRNELNQVILNLIVNAAHAIGDRRGSDMGPKGKIVVSTERCGSEVEIRVQDDGAGIPQEVASRVFEPFFTTKPVGKGTGQGLAIARSVVVDKHGGSIRFESAPGAGTCFFMRLPLEARARAGSGEAR